MMFLFNILAPGIIGFLMLFDNEGNSFGIYEVKKSLTPLGWAIVVILPTALIFGAIYLAIKILKKPKLK